MENLSLPKGEIQVLKVKKKSDAFLLVFPLSPTFSLTLVKNSDSKVPATAAVAKLSLKRSRANVKIKILTQIFY